MAHRSPLCSHLCMACLWHVYGPPNPLRAQVWYETDQEWVQMVTDEWIAEIRGDAAANKEAKELTESGEVEKAKEVKRLRITAKVEEKKQQELKEEAGGVKLVAGATERAAEEATKAKADALGLGNIPPEVMAAMAAKREEDAKLALAKEKGFCVQCVESVGVMKCSRCLTVAYCGRDCQVAHWKAHKKACKEEVAKKEAAK